MYDVLHHPTLPNGLMAYYRLEGNAVDATPRGHDGTLVGSPTVGTGKVGNNYLFSGNGQCIDLGVHADFDCRYISLACWIKQTTVPSGSDQTILGKRDEVGVGIAWEWKYNSTQNKWVFSIRVAGTDYSLACAPTADTNWHLLVGTFDGSSMCAYLDGALSNSAAVSGTIDVYSAIKAVIAAHQSGGGYSAYFGGNIDEVGVWNRALTAAEVSYLYNGGSGVYYDEGLKPNRGEYVPFQLESISIYENQPRVEEIIAPNQNTVRVYYDQEMRCSNPVSPDDALNPTNYAIATTLGVPRTVSSVTLCNAAPTIVDLVLDGEMTNNKTYSCTVTGVTNSIGIIINENYNTQNFTGIGIAPQVSFAQALDPETIKIVFNEAMLNTASLRATSSYHFSGPTTLTPTQVTISSNVEVRVTVLEEMRDSASYSVSVGFPPDTGIQDIAWNDLDASNHTADFSGIGVPPQVLPDAIPKGAREVWVKFNEEVETLSAETKTNYVIMGGSPPVPLAVNSAVKLDPTTVRLNTDVQASARLYTITVSNVTDLVGNPVQPPTNQATFLGVGYSPPKIEFAPVNGSKNVGVRTRSMIHIYDDSTEFSGINRSSIWIRVSYTEGGIAQTKYAVYAGNLQMGFVGEVSGDPLTVDGLTYYLRPTEGWPENTQITIGAYAEDLEGSGNYQITSFITGTANCFEDILPAPSELDVKLLSSLSPFESAEKLRRLLLECCTQSSVPQVRARTLMYLAAVTDMKAFLAVGFDFAQVEDVLLCERNSMLSIHQAMLPYLKHAHLAVDALTKFSPETKTLLHKYLDSNSPIYVVNAVALVVVLTAIWEV